MSTYMEASMEVNRESEFMWWTQHATAGRLGTAWDGINLKWPRSLRPLGLA